MDPGFAIVCDVLSAAEVDRLSATLKGSNLTRSRAGSRHLMSQSAVAVAARDRRLVAIASRMLGADAAPYRATLFDKSPDSNWLVAWHQDTALPLESRVEASGWGPWSEKLGVLYAHAPSRALEKVVALRLQLDDSTAENGPLRVIPGSHVEGVLTDAQVSERAVRAAPVECVATRGSVVAMRPLIIHASSKAIAPLPRRVLHIEYAASLDLSEGMRLRIA
jgi:ectoine hydroxylase-related dioxygenase (phytanoyl-CoA dioxygenase family)